MSFHNSCACVVLLLALVGCADESQHADLVPDEGPGTSDSGYADAALDGAVDNGIIDPDMTMMEMEMETTQPLPENVPSPACGESVERGASFLQNAELDLKAERFDRVLATFGARGHGLNADLRVVDEAARAQVVLFADSNAWTAEDADLNLDALVASYGKAAGLYGGVGLAADAFRYMTLRDTGAACEFVERARAKIHEALELIAVLNELTGDPSILPRAIARTDLPGAGVQPVVSLFDEEGMPLPTEKNNGTWRADVSGIHPEFIWEDSCSRDMYVGWVMAFASIWEAIRTDPAFSVREKEQLRAKARSMLSSLRTIREEGFDLEIRDADGRRTYHGILNENSVDRIYIPGAPNAFNAIMATGIVQALAFVSEHGGDRAYADDLIDGERALLELAERTLFVLDLGVYNNFSGSNMAFISLWLGLRYTPNAAARSKLRTLTQSLYAGGEQGRAPQEQSQALYDLVYATAVLEDSAHVPSNLETDVSAIQAKVATILEEFPDAPFFPRNVINCDETEVESGDCLAEDGTPLPLLGPVGWNDELVADVPVPMRLRPHSNFYWRSNPYSVNGNGDPLSLLAASDFRFVYWFGRYLKVRP